MCMRLGSPQFIGFGGVSALGCRLIVILTTKMIMIVATMILPTHILIIISIVTVTIICLPC